MRILQISSAVNFGGGEKHFADLCRKLIETGHNVSVVARPNAVWLEKISRPSPEKIFHLALQNSLDIFSAQKIARIASENKIEIIHAHLARDYAIAALAARMTKTQLVLTRHLLFPLNSLYKFLLPKDSAFIAVAEGVRQKLLLQNIVPPEQIHLIYNGIDTRHYQSARDTTDKTDLRKRLNLPLDCKLVGIAGEITAHKGQTDFVRAALDVLKRFPETEFLIIGRDNSPQKKYQKQLEKLIAGLGLKNKIHLSGWFADVAPLYAMLDVFVSTSHTEPFGLAIAEAMASACAVVATATDGAMEIITNETGKIAPIGNPAAIAGAIIEFLSDEKMRQEFGKKAQTRVRRKFGVEKMTAATGELYKELLKAKF